MKYSTMRVVFAAAVAMPLTLGGALAQTELTVPPPPPALTKGPSPLLIAAGVVGAAVVADILTRGALSAPLLRATGLDTAGLATGPGGVVVRRWWRVW